MIARTDRTPAREGGNALVLALMLTSLLSGLTLLLLGSTQTSFRHSVEAEAGEHARLVLDGGLQDTISRLAATEGSRAVDAGHASPGWIAVRGGEFRFRTESLGADEPIRIDIASRVQTGVRGDGAADYQYVEAEVLVRPGDADVEAPGALMIDGRDEPGEGVTDGFHFQHADHPPYINLDLGPNGVVSGHDHSEDGLVDPDREVRPGLSTTPVYNEGGDRMDWDAGRQGTVAGSPSATNDSGGVEDDVYGAVMAQKDRPDVEIELDGDTDRSLGADDVGTASDPKFTKVTVADDDAGDTQITLSGNNAGTGHGILYIELQGDWKPDGSNQSLLEFSGGAKWKGLVVIRSRGEIDVRGGSSIVHIDGGGGTNHSQVLGSLAFFPEGRWDMRHETPSSPILTTNGGGDVLYSSETFDEYANATLEDPGNLEIVSYRLVTRGVIAR